MVSVKHPALTWRTFMDLLISQKPWMNEIFAEFDISPMMAHALHEIPETGSVTMSALAVSLSCDASNITGIVDRLEERGYVERRPSAQDRRVKCVVVTTAGKRLNRKIDERFTDIPPPLAALSPSDRQTLASILGRALAHTEAQRRKAAG